MPQRRPKITDIAPVSTIMNLRFRPAQRGGSRHIMTADELEATISVVEGKAARGNPNAQQSLALLKDEQAARKTETLANRTARLRQRLAWELAQERKEADALRWPTLMSELPIRYGARPRSETKVPKRPYPCKRPASLLRR